MTKENIDPSNVQISPLKEKGVDAIAGIESTYVGAPRPEYCREKPGPAAAGSGINTSLVAEAWTTILQAEWKR